MKLNKETRGEVRVGTKLSHGAACVQVVDIEPSGRFLQGLSISARVISWFDDAPWMVGRILRYEPLSNFYGDEIDNTDAVGDGDKV